MSNWLDTLENPDAVTSLFDVAPSLDNVDVTTLDLDRSGPTLTLSVLLREYPTRPPARWLRSGFNAAAIRLQILGVEALTLDGWSTENRVAITVERSPKGLLLLLATGPMLNLSCSCGWLRVDGVSAYRRQEDAAALS
jgi:hypothetical protein